MKQELKLYLENAHESNKYFEALSHNKDKFFCVSSIFSYGKEHAQNICDQLNEMLVSLGVSQKKDLLIDFIVWYKANRHLYTNSDDHKFMVETYLKSIDK